MAANKGTHTIMPKNLAQALMDAGMHHFDGGGLVGALNNVLGTGNTYQAAVSGVPQQNYQPQISQAQNQGQDIYGQQQNLAQTLLAQSQGQGPNVAQAQLNQATGQNAAQQGALMASQRGASVNPALIARQAAMQGAAVQQQGVGQAATLQAQQQLAAQQALAQQQQAMAQNQLQAQNINQAGFTAQNQQNINAQLGVSGINAQTAASNQAHNSGLLGGILQGAGSALGGLFHEGGKVPHYADGGLTVAPMNMNPTQIAPVASFGIGAQGASSLSPGTGDTLGAGFGALGKGFGKYLAGSDTYNMSDANQLKQYGYADQMLGGHNSTMDLSSSPATMDNIGSGEMMASKGAVVPGQASVQGNSAKNDKVPALLSPGEVVIDRETLADKGKIGQMARSVAQAIAEKNKDSDKGYKGVLDARAEKKACGGKIESLAKQRMGVKKFDDGGKVPAPTGDKQTEPNDRAKQAMAGAEKGQTLAEGWQNLKKFVNDPMTNLRMADGGDVTQSIRQEIGDNADDLLNTDQEVASNDTYANQRAAPLGGWDAKALGDKIMDQRAPGPWASGYQPAGMTQVLPNRQVDPGALSLPQADPQQAQQGTGLQDPMSMYNRAFGQQENAINQQFNAEKMKNEGMADIYQKEQNDLKQISDTHQKRMGDLQNRDNELFQAVSQGKVNPEEYWTGKDGQGGHSKVTAAIGIMLSGIGAGLQRSTQNLAMDTINKNIEKNIDAQKSNLSQANNLYRMNMESTHNEREAYLATKSDMLTMTAAQINQMAAKAGTPQAQAQAEMMKAQLGMQKAQITQQLAIAGVARQAYTDGVPAGAVPLLHPDQQKRMVKLPNGYMADAGNEANAKEYNEQTAAYQPLMGDLKELSQLNNLGTRLSPEGRAKAHVLMNHVTTSLNDLAKSHRISESDIGFQKGQLSDPTALSTILSGNAGTNQLMESLSRKMESVGGTYVPAFANMRNKQQSVQKQIQFKKGS